MKPNELEPLVGERVGGDGGSGHKSLSRRVQQFSGKWYGLLVSCFYALMSIIMTLGRLPVSCEHLCQLTIVLRSQ